MSKQPEGGGKEHIKLGKWGKETQVEWEGKKIKKHRRDIWMSIEV